MKRFILFHTTLFTIAFSGVCFGQIKPMGFTQKIITPINPLQIMYYPKLQVMNDTLFVCSNTGVYQKDMLGDSDWELYAFKDAPVIAFVRNGNVFLANAMSTNGRDSLLLLSRDGGKSYEDYTSAVFWEYGKNHLYRISQNPQNPNSLLTIAVRYGLYWSANFGKNWQSLYPYRLNTDVSFVSFHPLDTTTIFYCGEGDGQDGKIYKSSDSGNTWSEYIVPGGDNCVHQIDFHPSNPNTLIFGGAGKIGKSTDKGETWEVTDLYDTGISFYKILFDKDNPDILYTSGTHGGYPEYQDTIWVYRSTDTGETWHLAYKEPLGANGGGVIDMVKYKDKLIFYTRELGILELDVKTTPALSTQNIVVKRDLTIYPNPVVKTMRFETNLAVSSVEIINSIGSTVLKAPLSDKERSVDVSKLNQGIYLAVFHAGNQRITRKVCIKR